MNKKLLWLVLNARSMYEKSGRKRKPKHLAEGINFAILHLLSTHEPKSPEHHLFQLALNNANNMSVF